MSAKNGLLSLLLGWLCVELAGSPLLAASQSSSPPNIRFIMADDHAAHAISAYCI